jgi:hypothetical protein
LTRFRRRRRQPEPEPAPEDVRAELRSLTREVSRLNSHNFIRMHNSLPRVLAFNFARGLVFGLGSVLGATLLLSIIAWFLSQVEFLPIIGDWATQIAQQIEEAMSK